MILKVPQYFITSIMHILVISCTITVGRVFIYEYAHQLASSENNLTFVGAFCFPHGAIILDPRTRNFSDVPASRPESQELSIKLHDAAMQQARILIRTKPDLIIFSTPHGLKLQNQYLVLGNKKATGSAAWEGDWTNFTANLTIADELSRTLVKKLREEGNSIDILFLGDTDNDALPLRWAEVIPFWFINEAAKEMNFSVPPVIILGQPNRRLENTQGMIPELLKLGSVLMFFIFSETEFTNKRIAVVISSDLSHAHSNDSSSPYPWNPNSTLFDNYIQKWAKLHLTNSEQLRRSTRILVDVGGDYVNSALSCGFSGLVMLQGMLQMAMDNYGYKFYSTIIDYSFPTYFGMMLNYFIPA